MKNWLESRFLSVPDTITFHTTSDLAPVERGDRSVFEIGTWMPAREVDWVQIDSAVDAVLERCRVQSPKV